MSNNVSFHDLSGKHVFITGGGAGIGAALTEGFLRQGANVSFVQRSNADPFCDAMEAATNRRPQFFSCDISDVGALRAAIESSSKSQGAIDVLINNAANDQRHRFEEVDEAFWDWSLAINLKAYFFACQTVVPAMRDAGSGSIINFSSISYIMGNAGYPVYTTANSGITGMTRSLAREFGPDNIRVNALVPGWVLTERQLQKWATPEALAAHLDRQCLKRHLKPEDLVAAALFLASDASRMMTGQALVVDGGVVVTG